jgi:hypothetical protein
MAQIWMGNSSELKKLRGEMPIGQPLESTWAPEGPLISTTATEITNLTTTIDPDLGHVRLDTHLIKGTAIMKAL